METVARVDTELVGEVSVDLCVRDRGEWKSFLPTKDERIKNTAELGNGKVSGVQKTVDTLTAHAAKATTGCGRMDWGDSSNLWLSSNQGWSIAVRQGSVV